MDDHFLQCLNETKTNPYFHLKSYGYSGVETYLTLLYPLITFSIMNNDLVIIIQGVASTLAEYRYFMNFELLPRLTHFLDEREKKYSRFEDIIQTCFQSYGKTIEVLPDNEDRIIHMYKCWKRDYPKEYLTLDMLHEEGGIINFWENLRKHNHYKDGERNIFDFLYQSYSSPPIIIYEYLEMIQSKKSYMAQR